MWCQDAQGKACKGAAKRLLGSVDFGGLQPLLSMLAVLHHIAGGSSRRRWRQDSTRRC